MVAGAKKKKTQKEIDEQEEELSKMIVPLLIKASIFVVVVACLFHYILDLGGDGADKKRSKPLKNKDQDDFSIIFQRDKVAVVHNEATKMTILTKDHSVLGAMWDNDKENAFSAFLIMEAAAQALFAKTDGPSHILALGLGTGVLGKRLSDHSRVTAVEMDENIIKASRKFIGISSLQQKNFLEVHRSEATKFIEFGKKRKFSFDYIIHDLWDGMYTDEQKLTKKMLQGMKELLKPDGVLLVNVIDCLEGAEYRKVRRELTVLFGGTVRCFLDEPRGSRGNMAGNILCFAAESFGRLNFTPPKRLSKPPEEGTSAWIFRQYAALEGENWELKEAWSAKEVSVEECAPEQQKFRERNAALLPESVWGKLREKYPEQT